LTGTRAMLMSGPASRLRPWSTVSVPSTQPYRSACTGSHVAASAIGADNAVAGNCTGPPVQFPAEPLLSRNAGTHNRGIGGVSRECVASRNEPSSWIFSSRVIWARTRLAR